MLQGWCWHDHELLVAVGWVDPEWPLRLWLKTAWKAGRQYTHANATLICMLLSGISGTLGPRAGHEEHPTHTPSESCIAFLG